MQLLALSAVWNQFAPGGLSLGVAWGLIFAASAFFLGPLARAMDRPSIARPINLAGALIAVPTYLLLPVTVLV